MSFIGFLGGSAGSMLEAVCFYMLHNFFLYLKDNFDLSVMYRPLGRINLQYVSKAIVTISTNLIIFYTCI